MGFHVLNYNFRNIWFPLSYAKFYDICILRSRKHSADKSVSLKNKFRFQKDFQEFQEIENHQDDKLVSANLLENDNCFFGLRQKKRKAFVPLKYRGEILYGVHSVYLALLERRRKFHCLFIRRGSNLYSDNSVNSRRRTKIIELARYMNIPIHPIDSRVIKHLAPDAVHQGICLDAEPFPVLDWNENRLTSQVSGDTLWLIIDEILDPMNVGAIIRSAYYFGIRELFITKGYSCKLSSVVSKASSGCLEVMTIYQIECLEDFIKARKSSGWNIISTVTQTENDEFSQKLTDVREFQIIGPSILILGNEGKGISSSIQNLCDIFVSIPPSKVLHEGIDSLNVSVAAGIILHSLCKGTKKS